MSKSTTVNAGVTPDEAPSARPTSRRGASGTRRGGTGRAERLALLVTWVAVIVVFGALEPGSYLTIANFANIFGSQAVLVVLALGLLVPLTVGDYDLSVASILTLSAMVVGILNVNLHLSIVVAIVVAASVGLVCGVVNGAVVTLFDIDPFIVTLGTSTVIEGIVFWISNSNTITGIAPALSTWVVTNRFLGIPLEAYYGLVLCVVLWYVFDYTPLGQRLLYVGQGRMVARLSGINVSRIRFGALVTSGLIAGMAGVLYAGSTGSADPTSGTSFLLPAFAAAFLGATAIRPGRFNPWGTIIAAYFLISGITGLQLFGANSYTQDLFYGGALVVAVVLSQVARRRRTVR